MPSHARLKLGFDENVDNSCYQTASMVALFLFPSQHVDRLLRQRRARSRHRSAEERRAQEFLQTTAQQLSERRGQLSTQRFLELRQLLSSISYAEQFAQDGPNDAAEWIDTMLRLLAVPTLLPLSHMLHICIAPRQSVQSALDNHLAQCPALPQTPPLLLLNLQRNARKTRSGLYISENYRIQLNSELSVSVRGRIRRFSLRSVIAMNRYRTHYLVYVRDRHDNWFLFSDINGEYQRLPQINLDAEPLTQQHISMLCNAHLLVYEPC